MTLHFGQVILNEIFVFSLKLFPALNEILSDSFMTFTMLIGVEEQNQLRLILLRDIVMQHANLPNQINDIHPGLVHVLHCLWLSICASFLVNLLFLVVMLLLELPEAFIEFTSKPSIETHDLFVKKYLYLGIEGLLRFILEVQFGVGHALQTLSIVRLNSDRTNWFRSWHDGKIGDLRGQGVAVRSTDHHQKLIRYGFNNHIYY